MSQRLKFKQEHMSKFFVSIHFYLISLFCSNILPKILYGKINCWKTFNYCWLFFFLIEFIFSRKIELFPESLIIKNVEDKTFRQKFSDSLEHIILRICNISADKTFILGGGLSTRQ